MICPYCQHEFPLTWARYFGAPFGKHTCPHCEHPSKFRMTATYLLVLVAAWPTIFLVSLAVTVIGLVVAAIAVGTPLQRLRTVDERVLGVAVLVWLAATWAVGIVISAIADKYYDEHYRTLEKLPNQSTLLDDDDFLDE